MHICHMTASTIEDRDGPRAALVMTPGTPLLSIQVMEGMLDTHCGGLTNLGGAGCNIYLRLMPETLTDIGCAE